MDKPFYEMNVVELMDMDANLLEYQFQEGVPPGLAAKRIKELAAALFTAEADLRDARQNSSERAAWIQTFRAALTGRMAQPNVHRFQDAVSDAEKAADMVHGSHGPKIIEKTDAK